MVNTPLISNAPEIPVGLHGSVQTGVDLPDASTYQQGTSGGSSYERTGRPPSPSPLNQIMAGLGGATQTRGQIFTQILNVWPLFCIKIYKKLSASRGFVP